MAWSFNGDIDTAEKYYMGKCFNLCQGEYDLMAKCIEVQEIK